MISEKEITEILDDDIDCGPDTIVKLRLFVSEVFKGEPRYSVAELEKILENAEKISKDIFLPDGVEDFIEFLKDKKRVEKILNG